MRMFDATTGRFNAGTVPVGTQAGPGICSTETPKGNDVVNSIRKQVLNRRLVFTSPRFGKPGSPRLLQMLRVWSRVLSPVGTSCLL